MKYQLDPETEQSASLYELFPLERDIEDGLLEGIGSTRIRKVLVARSGKNPWESVQNVAMKAAHYFCGEISSEREGCVGISWGPMLAQFVLAVEKLYERTSAKKVKVYPTAGEWLLEETQWSWSANIIAMKLSEVLNGSEEGLQNQFVLTAPVYVPVEISQREPSQRQADSDAILSFIQASRSYQKLFGHGEADPSAMVMNMDATISGVGTLEPLIASSSTSSTLWITLAEQLLDEKERERLEKLTEDDIVLGEISGRLIVKEGIDLDEQDQGLIQSLYDRSRIFTPTLREHIKGSEDAREKETLGTFILAGGNKAKAKPIAELLKMGAVATLCVDTEIAEELVDIFKIKRRWKPPSDA